MRKNNPVNIEAYFQEFCCDLNREDIYELNKQDNGPINNVLTNQTDRCYGVHIYDDKKVIEYLIFYIDNKYELKGLALLLSFSLDEATRIKFTAEFCKIISYEFPHTDIIDSFNAIQTQARSLFEKMGFFTIGNEINNIPDVENAIGIVGPTKGILRFSTMNKINIYRWFFDEDENSIKIDKSKTKKVYLLLDSNTNLIKIGQSFYPKLREKTLHGESPKWDLLTTWIAPITEEKKLKMLFRHKRERGEWFRLNFDDLQQIKEYMSKYKKSPDKIIC